MTSCNFSFRNKDLFSLVRKPQDSGEAGPEGGAVPWQRVTLILELLQHKKKLKRAQMLVPVLFSLLSRYSQASVGNVCSLRRVESGLRLMWFLFSGVWSRAQAIKPTWSTPNSCCSAVCSTSATSCLLMEDRCRPVGRTTQLSLLFSGI